MPLAKVNGINLNYTIEGAGERLVRRNGRKTEMFQLVLDFPAGH